MLVFSDNSFQGYNAVKLIKHQDHLLLQAAAYDLPLEPRARILPEERLEAALLLDDRDAVEKFILKERPGIAEQRAQYLFTQASMRDRHLVDELQNLYNGQCQICLWHPRQNYGHTLCHWSPHPMA